MRNRSISAALALLVALGPVALGLTAQAATTKAPATGLAAARAALAKASPAELSAKLEEATAPLPIHDAITLVDECLPKLQPADRAAFLVKTAGMSLLVGGFSDASARYESAASLAKGGKDAGLLVKAGRCALAAGDADKATELSALVLAAGADASSTAGARLIGAWALAFRGRASDALAIAAAVAAQGAGAASGTATQPLPVELRREARFLAWLCSAKDDKAKAAAALAAEYPGSPEALVASGAASTPPLPHWYLGELGPLKGRAASTSAGAPAASSASAVAPSTAAPAAATAPKAAAGGTAPATKPAAPATGPASAVKPTASGAATAGKLDPPAPTQAAAGAEVQGRLQVGYFSMEDNAKRLASELKSKGFSAIVDARTGAAGSTGAERSAIGTERRWIVLVDAGADPGATMRALKDSGYESYGVE